MTGSVGPDGRRRSKERSKPVTVETMRRRHVRSVHRIEEATNPHPWSMSLFLSELARDDGRIYLIARDGTRIVGYAGVLLLGDDAHVANVGVAESHRRRGVASRLLVEAFRRAIAEGRTAFTLEVRMSNTGARELYRRFGFQPAGARRGYYSDNGEDALIMWANDVAEPAYRDRLRIIEDELDARDHAPDRHPLAGERP